MYRAHPSWFMDIQSQKKEMLEANEQTSWTPDNLRTGRFHNIIEQAPDWNLEPRSLLGNTNSSVEGCEE